MIKNKEDISQNENEARKKYYREYYRKNKEKRKEYTKKYWEKKEKEIGVGVC